MKKTMIVGIEATRIEVIVTDALGRRHVCTTATEVWDRIQILSTDQSLPSLETKASGKKGRTKSKQQGERVLKVANVFGSRLRESIRREHGEIVAAGAEDAAASIVSSVGGFLRKVSR